MTEQEITHSREQLQYHSVAVVTTTFYKEWSSIKVGQSVNADQLRGDLAIQAIQLAKEKGYQLTIVDGGSSSEFRDALKNLGISVSDQQERGMSASRRQAFRAAADLDGVSVICWTEPEKISMVDHLEEAVGVLVEKHADIVIPSRTAESFLTYPEQQAKSEQKLNHLFSKVLRLMGLLPEDLPDLDVAFGPRIFCNTPAILDLFTRKYRLKENSKLSQLVKPDNYSNATFFPLMLALEREMKVISVPVTYHHPRAQTDFEAGNQGFEQKRIDQRRDIVKGAIQFARYLINNPQKLGDLLIS